MMNSSDDNRVALIPFDGPVHRDELLQEAEVELDETEEIREECLKKLRTLIREHNVRCVSNDDYLLRFLRSRKFEVQRSFDALRNYAKNRVVLHHWLTNFRPEILESCLRKKIIGFLPYRDYEGRLIILTRAGNWNKTVCTDEEAMVCFLIVFNYAAEDESAQIKGIRMVADEDGFHLQTMIRIMRHVRLINSFLFNCLPIRYRCIHIINEPWHYRLFQTLLFPFLPEKIKSRLVLHGKDRDVLFQHIPKCAMTIESGESRDCLLINDELVEVMTKYLQKLKEQQQYYLPEE